MLFNQGELGLGSQISVAKPTQLDFTDKQVSKIYAGFNHSLAIADKEVYAWGTGKFGQLIDKLEKIDKPKSLENSFG